VSESIWKKEISLKRKPKAVAPAPVQAAQPPAPAASATSESIWKKEISFKRKPKPPAAAAAPVPAAAPVEQPVTAHEAAPASPESDFPWLEQKNRWWNKELGSRKQQEPAQPAAFESAAEQAPAEPEVDPTLQALYDAVVSTPVEEWGAPAAVPPAPIEPQAVVPVPEAVVPRPEAVVPAPEAVVPVPAAPETEPVEAEPASVEAEPAPAEPAAAATSVWKKELSFRRKPKEPKAKKAEKEKQAKPEAEAPTQELKPPKQRRKLPNPSLRMPSLRKGGGGGSDRLVGLKIGGSQIAAARVNNNGVAELVQLARMPLQHGVVVGGELRDPEALAQALRAFFAENKLPRRGVRLGVASSRIGVRIFEISGIQDDRQFVNAVRFRAQEALPIPLDEAVLDYRVLSEDVNAEGETVRRVLLVVAHKDLVERYIEACRLAGIQLAGIDLEAFALLRSLAPPADRNGSALVAVAIGHERTTLAVSDGRVCEFTRVLEWGGAAINVALARALDMTPDEVEPLKRSLSLTGGPTPEELSAEQAQTAIDAVRRSIESLARDLVSSLQYYQGQPGSLGIGEVMLTGGTTHLVGLAEELERLLGVPVRVGDPLHRLKVSGPVTENDLGSLAIAIGLGIED
jgi:type IV pilus assembly protein PilM